ncbi:TetR/AcrR family transcriptional regulator [Ramlibacter sp. Leaf400]|uniref:TetR/AcrR family transcriptional regulator n=1 Tax=Ramlibacter sp. Leaf400 TaxID=1736365 RepID=UPI0009E66356|nr:TetR/AcrR family transcriptional regulator [Ramlibacter sp. Leaf400]
MATRSKRSTAEPPLAAAARPPAPEPLESPWTPGADRDRLRASKRQAVLRTAARVFNEKGFHATSLDELAERLHITKPTLYYYVKNKDEILFDCVSIGLQMLEDAIQAERARGGRAVDQLVAAMRSYVEIVTADFGMCVIRVGEDPLPPDSQRALRAFKAKLDAHFRELVRRGIEEGSIRPCDPKIAAFTLAGALSWIGRWYRPEGPLPPEEIARQCIGLLTSGLCTTRGRSRLRTLAGPGDAVSGGGEGGGRRPCAPAGGGT